MKAIVTGGAGFIGSNLVEALVDQAIEVIVYDDFSTGSMENLAHVKGKIQIIKDDVRNREKLDGATRGCDIMFHLAAQVGNVLSYENPVENLQINAIGTINAVNACALNNVKKIVYSSSCAAYGETIYSPIDEKHPLSPVSPYAASKLSGEQLCLSLSEYHNLQAVCLRYFNVYGKNQRFNPYGNVLPIFAQKITRNEPLVIFGDGLQTRDFIDVRDVVQANILAMQSTKIGVFNIATGNSSSVIELVNFISTAVGKEVTTQFMPARVGEVRDSVANISKAETELKFRPKIGLKEGVKDYINWFFK